MGPRSRNTSKEPIQPILTKNNPVSNFIYVQWCTVSAQHSFAIPLPIMLFMQTVTPYILPFQNLHQECMECLRATLKLFWSCEINRCQIGNKILMMNAKSNLKYFFLWTKNVCVCSLGSQAETKRDILQRGLWCTDVLTFPTSNVPGSHDVTYETKRQLFAVFYLLSSTGWERIWEVRTKKIFPTCRKKKRIGRHCIQDSNSMR